MNTLERILADKRAYVDRIQGEIPIATLQQAPLYRIARRNFYGAVAAPRHRGPNLIAEIKHKSPSAGVIRQPFDPVQIAQTYQQAGAQALSVLTDEPDFGGRLEFLAQVRDAVELPLLRKDFIVDAYQIHESAAAGADAVLLIAEALEPNVLGAFAAQAVELGLAVLVEVHTRAALVEVLPHLTPELREHLLIGINNRDLKRQVVDLSTTESVADVVPLGMPIVSESGIRTRSDVDRVHKAGARALLVGEHLLRSDDISAKVRELVG